MRVPSLVGVPHKRKGSRTSLTRSGDVLSGLCKLRLVKKNLCGVSDRALVDRIKMPAGPPSYKQALILTNFPETGGHDAAISCSPSIAPALCKTAG